LVISKLNYDKIRTNTYILRIDMHNKTSRNYELDFFRGIALILMIYFHVIYDLKEIYGIPVVYEYGFNHLTGKVSAIIFILVSGISSILSKNNIRRGLKLLAVAAVITVVTHLYNPLMGIKFGILHFLGVCILTANIFLRLNVFILPVLGTSIILLSPLLNEIHVKSDFLFPLGIITASFSSSDYYPLIPWFGVFLFGLTLGKILYKNRRGYLSAELPETIINRIGRHTLLVYLVHQPVIIMLLSLYAALR
jgi:uncharacterized membrane protein